MTKDPWQVPDHKNKVHKPSQAWKRPAEDRGPEPASIQHPRLVRLIVFLLGMALLVFGLSLAFPVAGGVDPYLVRSVIIATIFGGAAAYWSRSSLLRIAKVAGVWAVIIVGVSGFYLAQSNFGDRFMNSLDPSGVTTTDEGLLVHRSQDGHFWLRAKINGTSILMMVDTGASNVVLSPDDADAAGFPASSLVFDSHAETANGSVRFARVRASRFEIGSHVFYDIPVTVNGAEMKGSLLGLSVLDRFVSVEFRGDQMLLRR